MNASWTFGRKLAAGFGVMVVVTLALSIAAIHALRDVIDRKDSVIDGSGENLIGSQTLLYHMEQEVAAVRAYMLTGDDRHLEAVRAANERFDAILQSVQSRDISEASARALAEIEQAERSYDLAAEQLLDLRGGTTDVSALVDPFEDRVIPLATNLAQAVNSFVERERGRLEESRTEADTAASRAIATLIGLASAAAVIAMLVSVGLTRTLSGQIATSVQHVRSSSAELQATASQQATSAREQATAMQEITTTIGELLASSRQIADSAKSVATIASETASSARAGDESVQSAREALDAIRSQVDTIVRHMLDLGRKSQQIGGILEVINELAEQTNILAINATIEASGAGDSGRRFAVVGEEIRKLADRVGSSTKDIRGLIEEVRAAVNTTVMATETGTKTVEAGAQRFTALAAVFGRIAAAVETTTEAAREIELSTKQQTTGVEQVNVAASNMAQTTKETEAASAQTLQTAAQLTALSDELARLVQRRAA